MVVAVVVVVVVIMVLVVVVVVVGGRIVGLMVGTNGIRGALALCRERTG